MAIALSTDRLDEQTDHALGLVDKLLLGVAIVCMVALAVYGVTRLF